MPIEVRELVIKASIDQGAQGGSGPAASGGASGGAGGSEEMIKACVEKVMAILKEKNER